MRYTRAVDFDLIKTKLLEMPCNKGYKFFQKCEYDTDGGNWRAFWWYENRETFPAHEHDVLAYPYGNLSHYISHL